jgi:hypothetical protein
MLVKAHRVDKSKIEVHSSNECSCNVLKFLSETIKIKGTAGVDLDIHTEDIRQIERH